MSLVDEINDPLELLKVEQALRSEHMKLDYRTNNNPNSISILDYTVIEALKKQIPQKPINHCDNDNPEWKCLCECKVFDRYNYCPKCGQKIKWRRV